MLRGSPDSADSRAGPRSPPHPGPAAGMAASLWMGDVSEGGLPGPARRNLSVMREEECEREESSDPQRVEVTGKGSSSG